MKHRNFLVTTKQFHTKIEKHPTVNLFLRWISMVCAASHKECGLAVLALLALVGCRPEVDCVPEAAALPDRATAATVAPESSLNDSEFSGRYLVLLDRSLGMRGFVRPGSAASKNLFRPSLANLQSDLRANGGNRIEFWGVSQENRDTPPVQLQLGEWPAYSALSTCRPKNEFSPTDCQSVYARFGRLEETVRRLDRGGYDQFRVAREDVIVIITDLQIDSSTPGDPGRLGESLRQLVAGGSAVGILGALSSFTGVIHDLPDTRREGRSRVLDDRRQPFFFIVVGPREPVRRTMERLEARLRAEGAGQADIGSILFLLSAGDPMERLERQIRFERNSGAEDASPYFARGSVPARHVQEGRIIAFKLKRSRLRADPQSPILTVHMEPEAHQQSALATTYRLAGLPDAQLRLWAASVVGGRGDGGCRVRWQQVEHRLERVEVPVGGRNVAGVGLRLRQEGDTIPIAVKTLYFLSWEVEVEARMAQVMPEWVQRWDVPFGRVEDLHQVATSRAGGRDYLGVGNLTELVNRLTEAQVHRRLGVRRLPVRVVFQMED